MPGMLVRKPRNGRGAGGGEVGPYFYRLAELSDHAQVDGVIDVAHVPAGALPELEDPATLGCLIAIAQHATAGDFALSIGNGWWEMQEPRRSWEGDDAASMIAALVDVVVGS